MDYTLLKAVEEGPKPPPVKEVQKYLGLSGYYRKFVKDYENIANQISDW